MAKSQTILVAGHVSALDQAQRPRRAGCCLLLLLLGKRAQLATNWLAALRLLHFRFCCCCPRWVKMKKRLLLRESSKNKIPRDLPAAACLEDVASRSTSCIICFSSKLYLLLMSLLLFSSNELVGVREFSVSKKTCPLICT